MGKFRLFKFQLYSTVYDFQDKQNKYAQFDYISMEMKAEALWKAMEIERMNCLKDTQVDTYINNIDI